MLTPLLGLLIGLAIGTTGVGGGVLTAPLLIIFLGIPPAEAVGTALAFSTITKITAIIPYLVRKQVHLPVLTYLLIGGIPGAIVGSLCLERIPANTKSLMLVIVGATVAVSAGFSLFPARIRPKRSPRPRLGLLSLLASLIGVEVGFSSAGAGALGTVSLFNFTSLAATTVVGTDLLFGLVVSAVGGSLHIANGSWQPALLLKLLAGGTLGSIAGCCLAGMLPLPALRRVVLSGAGLLGLVLLFHAI